MPLLDHFRPPLFPRRHWEGFHALWASVLVERLNLDLLPVGFFAEAQTHVGGRFEVDVGTFESIDRPYLGASVRGGVAVAEAPPQVVPPPDARLPIVYPDSIEVQVMSEEGGLDLVAAVELVSPGNKDRPETRLAFVSKCVTYLQQGVGLILVDIVTDRRANLHDQLSQCLGGSCPMVDGTQMYASAYRPIRREQNEHLDVWTAPLTLGGSLPELPLALRRGPTLMLDLESSYAECCRRSRLP